MVKDPNKDNPNLIYYFPMDSKDHIDFASDSRENVDFASDSRDHIDPDEGFNNETDLDPDRDSSGDSSGRRGDSKDQKNHIDFAMDQIDFAKDSRDNIDLGEDCQNPTDLDPDADSSSSGRKDSKDHIDRDEDCQPRTALDPDKDSSGDLLGRRDSNEYEEEDGDCPNPTGLDPDKDSSGDSACPRDGINLYKEEDGDFQNPTGLDPDEEEGTLASIFTDSEDVTHINEYVTEINEEDISEKEGSKREEEAAGSNGCCGLEWRYYQDCTDYCELEGRYYQDHIDLSPNEKTGLEEISEKDKEGSKKEEESAESSDFESEFEFDWDELRESLNKKDSDFGSKSEFEWRDGSKKEEESAESSDFESEFDEEESEESNDFEPESYEEEYMDYVERYDFEQNETGLPEAIQTGIGELNGIPVAIGVMDFKFVGGSMGAAVGEKITRLIEYATKNLLPLIIVCTSGGARVQEGVVSLMQMAKISSALYHYHHDPVEKKLFYISILASPTTGGVTASFGMLGDIIITEPDTMIAFAGKRVIEEVLKEEVPEGLQTSESLFDWGLFDPMVPRNILKSVLSELLELHGFFPLNKNQAKH